MALAGMRKRGVKVTRCKGKKAGGASLVVVVGVLLLPDEVMRRDKVN